VLSGLTELSGLFLSLSFILARRRRRGDTLSGLISIGLIGLISHQAMYGPKRLFCYCCLLFATQTRATYGSLCGMPACGQAVGCGVSDTPELWRGAAGLCCVRVYARVCWCWCRRICTYIHTCSGYLILFRPCGVPIYTFVFYRARGGASQLPACRLVAP